MRLGSRTWREKWKSLPAETGKVSLWKVCWGSSNTGSLYLVYNWDHSLQPNTLEGQGISWPPDFLFFFFLSFFQEILFIYLTERDTARERSQAGGVWEGEAGIPPNRESSVGLYCRTLGSWPVPNTFKQIITEPSWCPSTRFSRCMSLGSQPKPAVSLSLIFAGWMRASLVAFQPVPKRLLVHLLCIHSPVLEFTDVSSGNWLPLPGWLSPRLPSSPSDYHVSSCAL